MKFTDQFNPRPVITAAALMSLVLSVWYQFNQLPHFDIAQMYERGLIAVFDNIYVPHGNEASTTVNLPGSLSTLVYALPLKLWFNAWAPLILLDALKLASGLLFVNAVARLYSPKTVALGALLYFLNPWFLFESIGYNPSYLFFGASLVLNCLVHLRREAEASARSRFIYSCLAVLGIGWCLQFHFSWPVLLALCGLLWLRRAVRVSYAGLLLGVLLVLLTLIPYFIESLDQGMANTDPAAYKAERYIGYGLVHVYPLFKALLYWLRLGSLLITQKALLQGMDGIGGLIGIAGWIWNGAICLCGGLTLLLTAYCNYRVLIKERAAKSFGRELCLCALAATIIAAALATLVLNYWQIIIVFCFAIIPLLEAADRVQALRPALIIAMAVLALAVNVSAASNSEKYNYQAPSLNTQMLGYCQHIYPETKCAAAITVP